MTRDDHGLDRAAAALSEGDGSLPGDRPPRHGGRHSRGETGPVINRVVDILTAFTWDRPVLTLTQLSHRTGIPLTTVHRLVGTLCDRSILERLPSGEYQIGLRVWEFASLAPRGLGLREVAFPFMEDVFLVTRHNVQLAVREGHDAVFVERITDRSAVPVMNHVGGRFALHPTGVGRLLLAHAPSSVQEEVLAGPLEAFTSYTVTEPRDLRRVLAAVREQGFAVSDREVTVDAMSVAVPVRGADGTTVAALGLVVPAGYASPVALVPLLQTAARGISRGLAVERKSSTGT
ncbi:MULTISPECIES: IclR family transcriptional regulator [unclassified Streptomyces]|uniref:IclR family transcriptional regulator n=1 Tax=unclassified Streptomyces TaxID=2593676 RepID=UPI003330E99F